MQNDVDLSYSTEQHVAKVQNVFATYHPSVNLLYFLVITGSTVFVLHPVYLLLSLLGAWCYAKEINGIRAARFTLFGVVPILLFTAILNPLFHHGGVTVLWYFPSGNPLTLESILYGCSAGLMMAAMVLWFYCYTNVMTSDKFVYLFGRIAPAISLILSMTLRFVPLFYQQLQQIRETQKGIGRDLTDGTLWQRIRHGMTMLSILITWALEHAIETADSMKCRGYGLPGRTAFSIYRFEKRDKLLTLWITICAFCMAYMAISGTLAWQYYPVLRGSILSPKAMIGYTVYLALCLTPIYLQKKEARIWTRIEPDSLSNI